MDNDPLDAQRAHWERTLSASPEMFGRPSEAAREAAEVFRRAGKTSLLELGAGQGRDTLFLAQNEFDVTAVDYCRAAVDIIREKARAANLSARVYAVCGDVREPLTFEDASFDGCYSHMLFCMALTAAQLERLSAEIRRVLKPGGLNIYTVRNTRDPWYGTGIPRGEAMYEVDGFVVHFFDLEKVKRLATGYEIVGIDEFEEGELPRRLFRVTLRKA